MITIDLIDEHVSQSERPIIKTQAMSHNAHIGKYEHVYAVVQKQHHDLLRAAHTARLLKGAKNGGLAIEVQRFFERKKVEVFTLAERYASRSG